MLHDKHGLIMRRRKNGVLLVYARNTFNEQGG